MNLSTESLARTSSNRPWVVIGVWIAIIVAAIGINATLLEDALTTEFGYTNNPDSKQADQLLEDRLRGPKQSREIVAVQSESASVTVDDEAFKTRVEGLYGEITALGGVQGGVNYYQTGDPSMVSEDQQTTIMSFVMVGDFDVAVKNVEPLVEIIDDADGTDEFRVFIIGDASLSFEGHVPSSGVRVRHPVDRGLCHCPCIDGRRPIRRAVQRGRRQPGDARLVG